MPALFQLRPLFYRERGAGVYGTTPHCLALDTPYLAMNAVTALAFGAVVYSMASLRPGIEHFLFYYCSLVRPARPRPCPTDRPTIPADLNHHTFVYIHINT
jgi:hypothetical protein